CLCRRSRRRGSNAGKHHARHHAEQGKTAMSENIIGSSGSKVPASSVGRYLKNNLRESGMLLSLVAIMIFFQIVTGGVLMKPLNLTNLVLQNSYIVIMALGMLLIIVTGHIDLSVGSV